MLEENEDATLEGHSGASEEVEIEEAEDDVILDLDEVKPPATAALATLLPFRPRTKQ